VDEYAPPEVEPAQPRPRFDGWTPKRQTDFIAALRRELPAHACGALRNSERVQNRHRFALARMVNRAGELSPGAVRSKHLTYNGFVRIPVGDGLSPLSPGSSCRRGDSHRLADNWCNLPICGGPAWTMVLPCQPEPRKSAVSANWHASCKACCIGGWPANLKPRGSTMTTFSNYSRQLLAGFGAIAITVVLFANVLATQAAEVQSIAGILA
jgi:hypothetical protein